MKMNNSGAVVWIVGLVIFIFCRLVFVTLVSLETIFLFFFYGISISWFIKPYILGDDMNVPAYTHMLKKGEDDIGRLILFLTGLGLCFATAISSGEF
jgi:hypothetical protein